MFCQRKIYLKRVLKLKEPPTQPMIKGMLKHKVFDIFNKNEIVIVSSITNPISDSEIKHLYQENFTKITQETFSNYRNMAESFGITYSEILQSILKIARKEIELRIHSIQETIKKGYFGKELWRNLKPKYQTEFEVISEELGLKGRIDRVKFAEEIVPYEIKTREEIYESDKLQLAAYSLLLESEFNKKINLGVVEVENKQEEILISEELKSKVLEIADKIRNMKEAEFPSSFSKCEKCRLKQECFER